MGHYDDCREAEYDAHNKAQWEWSNAQLTEKLTDVQRGKLIKDTYDLLKQLSEDDTVMSKKNHESVAIMKETYRLLIG